MSENAPKKRDEQLCLELKEKTCEIIRLTSRVTMRAHHTLCCFCGYGTGPCSPPVRPQRATTKRPWRNASGSDASSHARAAGVDPDVYLAHAGAVYRIQWAVREGLYVRGF